MLNLSRKSLILISSISSIVGLFLIYVGSLFTSVQKTSIGEISSDLEGRYVSTRGKIVTKWETPSNHIFLTISDTRNNKIQVPIFSSLANKLKSNGIDVSKIKVGGWISVSGLVDTYKGQLQIVPKTPSDLKIEGDKYS